MPDMPLPNDHVEVFVLRRVLVGEDVELHLEGSFPSLEAVRLPPDGSYGIYEAKGRRGDDDLPTRFELVDRQRTGTLKPREPKATSVDSLA